MSEQSLEFQSYQSIQEVFGILPLAKKGNPNTSMEIVRTDEVDGFYFRNLEKQGVKLNKNQIQAVRTVDGPLLILAGAGSGKTSTLVARVGYMMAVEDIPAKNILVVTFTKKASLEMQERIGTLPGITGKMKRDIHMGTFHSVFLQMLRENGDKRTILSNEKQKQGVIKRILKEMDIKDDYKAETLLAFISYMKNQMIRPQDFEGKTPVQKEIKEIYKKYEAYKENNNYIDFDDILVETYYLLKFNPDVLQRYQNRFQYIMVDEFQDTSFVQYEIIRALAFPNNNLAVVGDDAQAIYGFRGAESEFILNFNKFFEFSQTVVLDINYRSTDSIVGLSNIIIKPNENQIEKELFSMKMDGQAPTFYRPKDAEQEAQHIIEMITGFVQSNTKNLRDFAVIYRTHAISRSIVDELVRRKIPFVTYGSSNTFYENTFVKPIIALMRLVLDPNDEDAILEVANMFYFKKDDVTRVLTRLGNQSFTHVSKLSIVAECLTEKAPDFQRRKVAEKIEWIKNVNKEAQPSEIVKEIRKNSIFGYDKFLEADERKTLTFDKEMVLEVLNEIESSTMKHSSIQNFLNFIDELIEVNENMEELRQDEDADVIRLMTIHQSKGLEFDTVFLIGWIEDILPHRSAINADKQEDRILTKSAKDKNDNNKSKEAIEEERRLAYVATSRAKHQLHISSPCTHHEKEATISRFLTDVLKKQ